jgi:phosphatidylethanolamine-binding protein (PEBP) family uncharacterized protein
MRMIAAVLAVPLLAVAIRAEAMTLSFDWGPTGKCFDPKSPPITVGDVPPGTVTIDFVMHDLDAPNFRHGGGTVEYHGEKSLGYGAFRYKGPCPPAPHSYEFTATARDAQDRVLATAKARRTFPEK